MSHETLNKKQIAEAVAQEREWLRKYNAVSAVIDGPVEDLQGMPLPVDLFQDEPILSEHPQSLKSA